MSTNKLGQPQVDMSQTKEIVCEKCGGKVFSQGVMLREVSPLLTGTGQKGILPIPVFFCEECGHVNQEFLPVEMKDGNNS